jgi:NRPS condensation-like uncharacterized protein
VVTEIPLAKMLALTRKNKVTINDVVISALTAATHLHHKKHGKAFYLEHVIMARDMRSYPLPYRYENNIGILMLELPA